MKIHASARAVVASKSLAAQPGKGALGDPTPWQHHKSFGCIRSFDDFNGPRPRLAKASVNFSPAGRLEISGLFTPHGARPDDGFRDQERLPENSRPRRFVWSRRPSAASAGVPPIRFRGRKRSLPAPARLFPPLFQAAHGLGHIGRRAGEGKAQEPVARQRVEIGSRRAGDPRFIQDTAAIGL